MACDTISWITGRFLSLRHPDIAGHWTRTFEYRCDIAVVSTRLWREVVVEESGITGDHNDHARVSTEYVRKCFRRRRDLTHRIRTNSMKPKLSGVFQSERDLFAVASTVLTYVDS
jgi:hypothetical protein